MTKGERESGDPENFSSLESCAMKHITNDLHLLLKNGNIYTKMEMGAGTRIQALKEGTKAATVVVDKKPREVIVINVAYDSNLMDNFIVVSKLRKRRLDRIFTEEPNFPTCEMVP